MKGKHLNKGIRKAIDLAPMLLDEKEILIPKLAQMIYKLYKTGIGNKELLEESLLDASGTAEKLLKELVEPVIISDLIK